MRYELGKITALEVKEYRYKYGVSMWDARKELRKALIEQSFNDVNDKGTHEEKIDWLMDRFAEDHDL